MTLRRSWLLTIAGFVLVGMLSGVLVNYFILLGGAERGTYEWLSGAYRNGTQAANEEMLEGLANEAQALRRESAVDEALSGGASPELASAIARAWGPHPDHQIWWAQGADGRVSSSLTECATQAVAAQVGGRSRCFVSCGGTPVMLATRDSADGSRLYIGYAIGEHYARTMSRITGAEVLIFDGRRMLASSPLDARGVPAPVTLDDETLRGIDSSDRYFDQAQLHIPGYVYGASTVPMPFDTPVVDAYVLADRVDTVDRELPVDVVYFVPRVFMEQGAWYSTLALGATSAIIIAVLVLLASRLVIRITRPLTRLADTATRIGRGEEGARVGSTGGPIEVQAVAAAFDDMACRLAELRSRDRAQAEASAAHAGELSRAHAELQAAHGDLKAAQRMVVDTSRRAGMAEVATNVLHNVGNVLNSVNVSTDVLRRQLEHSKLQSLERAVAMFPESSDELRRFMTSDPRSDKLAPFLTLLSRSLRTEHDSMMRELEGLSRSVDHLKSIVRNQQQMAAYKGGTELVTPCEIIDAAIDLQAMDQTDPAIRLERDYEPAGPILVDRHRVLQVVMNLLSNARHAVRAKPDGRGTIRVRIVEDGPELRVEVKDDGIGIPLELQEKIFQHGFTTKVDGHGFGLHGSANAASEMGGSLTAASDGPGTGATFVLRIPRRVPQTGEAA